MNPKVLYTTADASPQSGAFHSLLYMSRRITEHGYEPILALHEEAQDAPVLMPEDRERARFLDLPRARRGQAPGYYLRYCSQNARSVCDLVRLIRKERVTLVHVNEVVDLYGGIAARMAGVPCVWHVRADVAMMPRVWSVLSRVVLGLAARVVVVSESVRERMFEGAGQGKIVVVHDPGPDSTVFHPDVDGSPVRKEFGIADDASLVTLVAKLSERKGHKTLIRAAPEVLARFPDTHFMIVGGELEGERYEGYAKELRLLPRQLGVQDRVIFTGFRAHVPQIMAASDVIVNCSLYPDPFPGVVLQGMAVGRPVVASSEGGAREQIEDGISGVLVEAGDPHALAEAVCGLLADRHKRLCLGRAAAARIRDMFAPHRYFDALSGLYCELLSS